MPSCWYFSTWYVPDAWFHPAFFPRCIFIRWISRHGWLEGVLQVVYPRRSRGPGSHLTSDEQGPLRSRPWGIGTHFHPPWLGFKTVCGFSHSLSVFLSYSGETESSHPRQPGSHRLPPSSRSRIRPSGARTLRSRSSGIDIDTFSLSSCPPGDRPRIR